VYLTVIEEVKNEDPELYTGSLVLPGSRLLGGYKHFIDNVDYTVLSLNVGNFYRGIIDFYNAVGNGDIHVRSLKRFCGAQLDYIGSHYFPVNNVIKENLL
jgi:hypothetical protein